MQKSKKFNWKTLLQKNKLSINTLMGEVKQQLWRNGKFESWDMSKFYYVLDVFGLQGSDAKIKIHPFSIENFFSKKDV